MNSIWALTATAPKFKQLDKDIKTDVLIIGGGIAGVLCAYMMHQAGIDYVLAEASHIGSGITKNTTAKITSQHGLFYNKLEKGSGTEKAKLYLKINQLAIEKYRHIGKNVGCEIETKDAYVYSIDDYDKIADEYNALTNSGFNCEIVKSVPLPFRVAGALRFQDQAQFHPLEFLYCISKDLNIFEQTRVLKLEDNVAYTPTGKITAGKIIMAAHFPFINKHGNYFLKMYQHRSYVIALEDAPAIGGMYVDEAMKGMSFRNYKNMLFIGGGDHRTGKSGGNWAELEDFARKHYPQYKIKTRWATQDCITLDSVPYIGLYSSNTPELYVATGFNKWGMTSSMVAAMILLDMVQEKQNIYSEVFDPSRSILKPQLIANGFEAVVGLLTPKLKRCPHLGCALKWNIYEHTWDCPCHGSRFSDNGDLIDNPSNKNLK